MNGDITKPPLNFVFFYSPRNGKYDRKFHIIYRNKSGLWGWRSDKTEVVNGRDCKVFSASNVELVTKTRTEHLSPEDKSKVAGSGFLLNSLLAVGQHLEESTTPLPVNIIYF